MGYTGAWIKSIDAYLCGKRENTKSAEHQEYSYIISKIPATIFIGQTTSIPIHETHNSFFIIYLLVVYVQSQVIFALCYIYAAALRRFYH